MSIVPDGGVAEETAGVDYGIDAKHLPREDADGQPCRFDLAIPLENFPTKKGANMSSNGLCLLDDEAEVKVFAAKFLPLHSVATLNPWFTCVKMMFCGCCLLAGKCCGCYLTIPKKNQRMDIAITDKRIIIRDVRRKMNPGLKSCWFYMACCCCWKKETDEKYEGQEVLSLDDLKDVQMELFQNTGADGPACCPVERRQNQFKMVLYFTKNTGVYHTPTKGWAFVNNSKTSCMKTQPIIAFGNLAEAAEMRRILEEAMAKNQARDAEKSKDYLVNK